MGLCASMLQRKAKNRHPEPRRGTAKALFVVRNDRRQSNKPQALVVQAAQNPTGSSRFQKPGKAQAPSTSRKNEKCSYDCTDVLGMGRSLCLPIKKPRLPCGNTRSVVAVEPVAVATEGREPVLKGAATTTERSAVEGCRTPMTPRRTPLWQRRILMGTRCELPRFSGVILYDEHGRRLQSGTQQNRADHPVSRARKSEPKGNKKTAQTTTTLRDLL